MWYEFTQNNSGGSFDVDDKVCHRMFIEADTKEEATEKASDLGVYFNGVENGFDCSCCGDRWYSPDKVEIDKYKKGGYRVGIYSHYENPEKLWKKRYGKFTIIKNPEWVTHSWGTKEYVGEICFKNLKQYAQFLANEYGWTTPDARIYYKNGKVTEVIKEREK